MSNWKYFLFSVVYTKIIQLCKGWPKSKGSFPRENLILTFSHLLLKSSDDLKGTGPGWNHKKIVDFILDSRYRDEIPVFLIFDMVVNN